MKIKKKKIDKIFKTKKKKKTSVVVVVFLRQQSKVGTYYNFEIRVRFERYNLNFKRPL